MEDVSCIPPSHYCALKHCRSIVQQGWPFFLEIMTIGAHHPVEVPIGARVIIPHSMSLHRFCLIAFLQWYGTGIGVCLALGSALGLR